MRYRGFYYLVPLARLEQGEELALKRIGPNEVGFTLCRAKGGQLQRGPISQGTPRSVDIILKCPTGSSLEGLFHTHPGGVAYPSRKDIATARQLRVKTLCIENLQELRCFRLR